MINIKFSTKMNIIIHSLPNQNNSPKHLTTFISKKIFASIGMIRFHFKIQEQQTNALLEL